MNQKVHYFFNYFLKVCVNSILQKAKFWKKKLLKKKTFVERLSLAATL